MSSPDSELSEEETSLRSSDVSAPSSPAGGPFAPGHVVAGRYRMINLVGKGGMGEVFRVQDLTLDQEVALKFLPDDLAAGSAAACTIPQRSTDCPASDAS